jgi:predicted deacylase
VVSFLRRAGDWVEKGEALFEVVDPLNDKISTVHAGTAGVLFALERGRYALAGHWMAKVAGREPFRTGRLIND